MDNIYREPESRSWCGDTARSKCSYVALTAKDAPAGPAAGRLVAMQRDVCQKIREKEKKRSIQQGMYGAETQVKLYNPIIIP